MSNNITTKPDRGESLVDPAGLITERFQLFLDDLEDRVNRFLVGDAVIVPEYTVAGVPTASDWDNGVIIVSNETGGRTLATSDGTDWRRVSDGAVIS
jgi:hypothetical protein